mgnify:CR=1 FL=1
MDELTNHFFYIDKYNCYLERTVERCLGCKVALFLAEIRNGVEWCPECYIIVKGGIE